MIKRKFKLPGVEELTKDQDRVLRLPEDGQYLVVGGPGTGKSVVALLRTMKYLKNNNYVFLTYNRLLLSTSLQLVQQNLESKTLTSFIYTEYNRYFKSNTPQISPYKPDYDKIIEDFKSLNKNSISLHLIIDEGQDMPPKFYEALMYLGIENFFIVADQNQQITEDNSSRQELTDLLNLEVEDVIELKENFRNSLPIARFANTFFTDPSSPKPALPPESRVSLGIPILYKYEHYQKCVEVILREYDRDPRNLIGVVVANNNRRNTYVDALNKMDIELDNPKPTISTYSARDKQDSNIDFAYSGIVVLNDKSIKGLEFDIVFIIIDGFTIYNNDLDSMKKRFYVMSSRAIKKLVLFQHIGYKGDVDKILIKDENILQRKRLNDGKK